MKKYLHLQPGLYMQITKWQPAEAVSPVQAAKI